MLFSSIVFLWFFFPAAALLYTLVPGRTAKNAVLLAVSLIFYAWGDPAGVLLLLLTVLLCYAAGLLLTRFEERERARRAVIFVAASAQLGILACFKYFSYLVEIVNSLAAAAARFLTAGDSTAAMIGVKEIGLPLGISFFTFQALSYMFDVYRRKKPAQKNLFHLSLYICLFPQLLSGPIIKYHELSDQIVNRRESLSMTAYGIKRFCYGLAKKVLLANTFGRAADRMFGLPADQLGTAAAWLAVLLYTLQIYYDFSGYSDMAIGLGRFFGFRYAENFNYPYLSASITEFWRRWHISLSTWFKEYLYIPLGGNRKGPARTCVNLFIVFLATGIWHGATANFILWGIYHGVFILSERLWLSKRLEKNPFPILNRLYTMLVVVFGWLLFRGDSMQTILTLFRAMVTPTKGLWNPRIFADSRILFFMAVGFLFCGPVQSLFPKLTARLYDEEHIGGFEIAVMAALLLLSVTVVISGTYSAFIYFKF